MRAVALYVVDGFVLNESGMDDPGGIEIRVTEIDPGVEHGDLHAGPTESAGTGADRLDPPSVCAAVCPGRALRREHPEFGSAVLDIRHRQQFIADRGRRLHAPTDNGYPQISDGDRLGAMTGRGRGKHRAMGSKCFLGPRRAQHFQGGTGINSALELD